MDMIDEILAQEKKKPTQFEINVIDIDFDPRPKNLNDLFKFKK
jgi:hypothetical protein